MGELLRLRHVKVMRGRATAPGVGGRGRALSGRKGGRGVEEGRGARRGSERIGGGCRQGHGGRRHLVREIRVLEVLLHRRVLLRIPSIRAIGARGGRGPRGEEWQWLLRLLGVLR